MRRLRANHVSAPLRAGILVLLGSLISHATVYEVGPGKPHEQISTVPWEALQPGDTVLIHWRSEPYREKWVIGCSGTAAAPIVVRGVPDNSGARPVIEGNDARTRPTLKFWNEDRGIIKVGGASRPAADVAKHIVIENLEVRSARPPYKFYGADKRPRSYRATAAAIYIARGEHITIRNCALHDSGNGLFVSSDDTSTSQDILIERNHIFDNGNAGSEYEHNAYTAAQGIIFQYNHFGPLRAGCQGINLKDRSAGTVVRYNWIEGGNLELSLVEAEDSKLLRADPRYRQTFVYGNVLIEPAGDGLGLIARYGGDGGKPTTFRKGSLFFYNNTIVSHRRDRTTILKLSTNEERCEFRNNIVYTAAPGKNILLAPPLGVFVLRHNWFNAGWQSGGHADDSGTTLTGAAPGFVAGAGGDFHLGATSPCINAGGALPAASGAAHAVVAEYVPPRGDRARTQSNARDLGAFEFGPGSK